MASDMFLHLQSRGGGAEMLFESKFCTLHPHVKLENKDGGPAIRSVIADNPMLHANFTALCVIEAELLAMTFVG